MVLAFVQEKHYGCGAAMWIYANASYRFGIQNSSSLV
jgi:hypothetical protein